MGIPCCTMDMGHGTPWDEHGHVFLWIFHGFTLVLPCFSLDFSVDLLWNFHEKLTGKYGVSIKNNMNFPCFFLEFSMGLLWLFDGKPMVRFIESPCDLGISS